MVQVTEEDEAMAAVGEVTFSTQESPWHCLTVVLVYGVGVEVTGTWVLIITVVVDSVSKLVDLVIVTNSWFSSCVVNVTGVHVMNLIVDSVLCVTVEIVVTGLGVTTEIWVVMNGAVSWGVVASWVVVFFWVVVFSTGKHWDSVQVLVITTSWCSEVVVTIKVLNGVVLAEIAGWHSFPVHCGEVLTVTDVEIVSTLEMADVDLTGGVETTIFVEVGTDTILEVAVVVETALMEDDVEETIPHLP